MFQYSRIFQRHDQINSPSLPKEFIVKTVLIIFIVSIAFSALIGASVWDQHMNKAEFARGDVEALRKDEQDERQRQEEYEQWYNKPRVRSEVIVEAGSDGVDVSSFLLDREEKGYFVGDLSAVDLDKPIVKPVITNTPTGLYLSEDGDLAYYFDKNGGVRLSSKVNGYTYEGKYVIKHDTLSISYSNTDLKQEFYFSIEDDGRLGLTSTEGITTVFIYQPN